MHPNIRFTTPLSPGTTQRITFDDFFDLPSPPLTGTESQSGLPGALGNISLQEFLHESDPRVEDEDSHHLGKGDVGWSQVTGASPLAEIGGDDHPKRHQRVHILPPSGTSDEAEQRLMMLMVPVIEKAICNVDDEELAAISESLDENWGSMQPPQNNSNAIKVRAVLARRGYEITKAAIEKGSLCLSVYKKEFTGFMKMALPKKPTVTLAAPPRWKLGSEFSSQQGRPGTGALAPQSYNTKDRPRLRGSSTSENLRAQAAQTPTPLYPKAPKELRPSSSTADIRSNTRKNHEEPRMSTSSSITIGHVRTKSDIGQSISGSIRPRSNLPQFLGKVSTKEPYRGLMVSSVATANKLHSSTSALNLYPCASIDIDQHRMKALEATMAFGDALVKKIDRDNEGYITTQISGNTGVAASDGNRGTLWHELPKQTVGSSGQKDTLRGGREEIPKTNRVHNTTRSLDNLVVLVPKKPTNLLRKTLTSQRGHCKSMCDITTVTDTTHRAPRGFIGAGVGEKIRAESSNSRSSTSMGLKQQISNPHLIKRTPSQLRVRDIKWN